MYPIEIKEYFFFLEVRTSYVGSAFCLLLYVVIDMASTLNDVGIASRTNLWRLHRKSFHQPNCIRIGRDLGGRLSSNLTIRNSHFPANSESPHILWHPTL